jgi:5-methylcytosine-specific restriction endonuclease McrA
VARRRGDLSAAKLRRRVEKRANWRCEYCHAPQRVSGYRFHLEHIVPIAQGGSDAPDNRALACATCNLAKADRTAGIDPRTKARVDLFNPRSQIWEDHFRWAKDQQTIIGRTPTGRSTVATLDMNSELFQEARRLWFQTGWLP